MWYCECVSPAQLAASVLRAAHAHTECTATECHEPTTLAVVHPMPSFVLIFWHLFLTVALVARAAQPLRHRHAKQP